MLRNILPIPRKYKHEWAYNYKILCILKKNRERPNVIIPINLNVMKKSIMFEIVIYLTNAINMLNIWPNYTNGLYILEFKMGPVIIQNGLYMI